jgi:hypothetical protein
MEGHLLTNRGVGATPTVILAAGAHLELILQLFLPAEDLVHDTLAAGSCMLATNQ